MEEKEEKQCCYCEHCGEDIVDDFDLGKLAYCKLIGCLVQYYGDACKCFKR